MLDNRVAVGKTHLGHALFAKSNFSAGDRIASITGDVVTEDGYGSPYCIDLGDGTVLEPGEPFSYLNHSCEPNCELVIWESGDEPSDLCVHALTAIEVDDELTVDYGWSANSAIPCLCKSPRCRGWIVDKNELPLLQQA